MMAKECCVCNKVIDDHVNYCSWECVVLSAKQNGGEVIAPNNLPIVCVRNDNTMLEHAHADHVDYKYPVEVLDSELYDGRTKVTHALIYNDDCIAVTLFECSYFMWSLSTGKLLYGNVNSKLTLKNLEKIKSTLKKE